MGDAIAVALMECRNFSARDFARFHPGGVLGKRLYMRVSDLCQRNERPAVRPDASLRDTVLEMTSKMLGCTVVMDNDKILGIVCDGDLRRMMKKHKNLDNLTADDIMSPNPKTIPANEYAIKALNIMRANSITQLIVVDDEGKYISVLHIHDILREGII